MLIRSKKDYTRRQEIAGGEIPVGWTAASPIPGYPNKWSEENFDTDEGNWIIDIIKYKEFKKDYIVSAFEQDLASGYFASSSLGIVVDCRRSGIKNDLQNVENLIKIMTAQEISSITYKGYTESISGVTTAQLQQLALEMELHVFALYTKKHTLEQNIDLAETVEDLDNIVW